MPRQPQAGAPRGVPGPAPRPRAGWDTRADARAPRSDARAPRAGAGAPRSDARAPRAGAGAPRSDARAPRLDARAPRPGARASRRREPAGRRRARAGAGGSGIGRRVLHGSVALGLAAVAIAGLTWTILVPPDGDGGDGATATSALDNQLPPPPPPPPPQQWRPVGGDEFDGSRIDRSVWTVYNSPGGFGNGLRRPSALSLDDGLLTVTARPRAAGGGVSGGMAMHSGQLYGRWEFRARTDAGTGYSPAILLWPDSERFPDDGELDMMEIPYGDRSAATAFVHYGAENHIVSTETPGDFTQWHTFALEWLPDRITWYVDGEKKWEVTDRRTIPTTPMHLCIQLDQGPAEKWIPAPDATTPDEVRLQVDWARVSDPVG
ncbi:glycoside hydrolase family 16 protein [Pseudonocardia sp. EC080625-04]|uniref:glycoside hydrolase family 16 protein n=1 Tax=Pseudonocardia sp. EC080625-04 TaxID=1096868 RepID=UPI000761DDEE|nr:glycoside hydrolase family 16 protein [Pseudonocardia sp. EC080625-04]